jgi:hypothetical protein
MSGTSSHRVPVPTAIRGTIAAIRDRMRPSAIWLFGSRARGEAGSDSDWDLVVSLPDDANPDLLDPLVGWNLQRASGVRATILATRSSDLATIWGLPNTIGFALAREGCELDV